MEALAPWRLMIAALCPFRRFADRCFFGRSSVEGHMSGFDSRRLVRLAEAMQLHVEQDRVGGVA